jgi:apolipoprotein N-acyltransferase
VAAAASGAAVAVSFPPCRTSWLAFFAFAPLLWALDEATTLTGRGSAVLRAGMLGLVSGFATTLWGFGFLVEVLVSAGGLPRAAAGTVLVALSMWSGLGVGLVAALAARTAASGLPVGIGFALLYALHERVWPALMPWCFGAVWLDHGPVALVAAHVGRSGLTALALLPAAALVALSRAPRSRRTHVLVAGTIVLVLGAAWAGTMRAASLERVSASDTGLRVGLVHLEPPRDDARLTKLLEATRALERAGAELVVWSEGAVPGLVPTSELEARFGHGLPGVHVPTWVGVVLVDAEGRRANTALFVTPAGIEARQDKRSLLPFAERTPRWVPVRWLGLPRRDFVSGQRAEIGRVGGVRTAATICYEDTLDAGLRELLHESDAELVVNLTHDGWFAHEPEVAERHLLLARLGAIELGRDVVRATDAGVTAWIDATGEVRARTQRGWSGLLTTPTARDDRTIHAAVGSAPLMSLVVGALVSAEAVRRRRLRTARGRKLSPSGPS